MKSLNFFKTHALEQQSKAELMQRKEVKFILHRSDLDEVLMHISNKYTLLSEQNKHSFAYQSVYFDTPCLSFYTLHHNGNLPRYKVRIRRYLDFDLAFLEVKKKCNRASSSKFRVLIDGKELTSNVAERLIDNHTKYSLSALTPSLESQYLRSTLMSHDHLERVTLDSALSFQNLRNMTHYQLEDLAVVEIKREQQVHNSFIYKKLIGFSKHAISFSKYCVGIVLTDSQDIKKNAFKPLISRMSNISNTLDTKGNSNRLKAAHLGTDTSIKNTNTLTTAEQSI